MKFTCEKEELVKTVSAASKAVPTKTTLPVLECFLITAENNSVKVTGNNMELAIEAAVEGDVTQDGKIAVSAKTFRDMIKSLPSGTVSIESDANGEVKIKSGKAKFKMLSQDPDNYPEIPVTDQKDRVEIPQDVFRDIIRQTIFAVSENENNKVMTGEYLEIDGDVLRLTALDGHRIAIRTVKLPQSYGKVSAIIPGKTLDDISRIVSGSNTIGIYFNKNYVRFEFDGTVVVSRLIEGNYFNVDQLISNGFESTLTASRLDFMAAIDRANLLVANGERKPVVLDISDDSMSVNMNTMLGNLNETLDIVKKGKDMKIGFNPKFLSDVFKATDDDEITVGLVSPKAPCYIKDADETYSYIILPVNFAA